VRRTSFPPAQRPVERPLRTRPDRAANGARPGTGGQAAAGV